LNFLAIEKLFRKGDLIIKTLVLERPSFRKIRSNNFSYWTSPKYYPEKYTPSLNNVFKFVKEIFWFRKHINTFSPNVVLTIDSHCLLLSEVTKLIYRKKFKTIVTMHNNLKEVISVKSTFYLHWILRRILKFLLNRADKVVCVSQMLSQNLHRFFELKRLPTTIYNGLSLKRGRPKTFPTGKVIILSIARFAEQKDHETLLKAFALLNRSKPGSELWLAGEGPLKKGLTRLADSLGLKHSVKFLGWRQNPNRLINKSHVFVLSSKREGFGYVLIEAMSQGIPVVSSDVPFGPREILEDGKYGILVPPGKPDALKNAILKILTKRFYNYYSRVGLFRPNFFSREKMLRNYKELILETLDGDSRTPRKARVIK